jgi:hypothetical protein
MWRIETVQTSLRSLDVEAMCRIYDAPTDLTEALMGLAKETKARGWWHAYGDVIPEGFDVYIGLEEAASQLAWYESELVPGLLQTEDYARTLIEADNPGVDAEEISRRVHVRIARQPLVHRATSPLQLSVALNEGILRRPVGGPRVMSEQLARLAEVSERPNVSLRVVPFMPSARHRFRDRSARPPQAQGHPGPDRRADRHLPGAAQRVHAAQAHTGKGVDFPGFRRWARHACCGAASTRRASSAVVTFHRPGMARVRAASRSASSSL